MINYCKSTVRGLLMMVLLLSAPMVRADIHDRIEYKLNRILKDVDVIINGNSGNCRPINQLEMDQGGGVFVIDESGEWCLTEDVTGEIVVDADCVCINLACHTLTARDTRAITGTGAPRYGLKVANGCITGATEAGIVLSNYQGMELYNLQFRNNPGAGVNLSSALNVSVHDVDFVGAGAQAAVFTACANIVVADCKAGGLSGVELATLDFADCVEGVVRDVVVAGSVLPVSGSAAIRLLDSQDIFVERVNVDLTSSVSGNVHGISISGCTDVKVVDSLLTRNQGAGIELSETNVNIALIENVAMQNIRGFDFIETSTATCCLVQDCRAISNTEAGFVHATSPLRTMFIGNEAHCNGESLEFNYLINGGLITLQHLSWTDGNFVNLIGNAEQGARFTNLIGSEEVPNP